MISSSLSLVPIYASLRDVLTPPSPTHTHHSAECAGPTHISGLTPSHMHSIKYPLSSPSNYDSFTYDYNIKAPSYAHATLARPPSRPPPSPIKSPSRTCTAPMSLGTPLAEASTSGGQHHRATSSLAQEQRTQGPSAKPTASSKRPSRSGSTKGSSRYSSTKARRAAALRRHTPSMQ